MGLKERDWMIVDNIHILSEWFLHLTHRKISTPVQRTAPVCFVI